MLHGKPIEEWVEQYAESHRHPVNRFLHTFGIPMIVLSLAMFAASILLPVLFRYASALFIFGWLLQFLGHAFERKSPEFFHDWRFLLVGTRWWWSKMRGKA